MRDLKEAHIKDI